jgi:hypothetical protein
LRYKHLLRPWVPNELPQLDTELCVNERIYHIAPSSIHGLGLFSMDGIKVKDGGLVELMEYVGPCYNYGDWLRLVRYCWPLVMEGSEEQGRKGEMHTL